MKKIITVIIVIVVLGALWYFVSPLFTNTTVDESLPITIEEEVIESLEVEEVQAQQQEETEAEQKVSNITLLGNFEDADQRHQGEGELLLVTEGDQQFLRFENFSVTNGPDLFVTLNKGSDPYGEKEIIARLKGNEGNQNYDISEYDLSQYQSVSIYCKAFTTEFATAQFTY